jgi:YidC/Oxa1 family membrane protein insertase
MLNSLFEVISGLLSFFYDLVPNYAIAIAMLTCVVMLITTPLTLKGTRSMIEMQRMQPEIRRLQAQYKGDRQKLNEEMMKFYKEHEINPVGGCLPMLIQLPVFSILFWVIRGLINPVTFVGLQKAFASFGFPLNVQEGFAPKYLDENSALYKSLLGKKEMVSFGVDLSMSPLEALKDGFVTALPYMLVIIVIGALAWYQQKQIMGRNQSGEVNPQQQMMMRLGPVMQVGFTFISPAALGIYFLVSTAWRVAQQTYITRAHYKGEDSIGVQAQKAMAAVRADKTKNGNKTKATNTRSTTKASGSSSNGSSTRPKSSSRAEATAGSTAGGAGQAKPHPRSRKKKKRK